MFRFCLLFAGVAFLEKKLETILRLKTAHFKAKKSILTELHVPSYA